MSGERQLVQEILADLTDRRGFRQVWDSLDDDIKEEITIAWQVIAGKYL